MTDPLILPLTSPEAQLHTVGGKGLNLAILARHGFQVPGGFFITTAAYHQFVLAHNLTKVISHALHNLDVENPTSLQAASTAIRAGFTGGEMPQALGEAILQHYEGMGAVAVRSSATAEDLPDLSFAGQQDTFLNVVGRETLLQAVVSCWSSLWTARAIGYRSRNHIEHHGVALAVVVQEMVPSEASGVLFTANPLNGLRTEMVIDATFGLGEALVSGMVEPDRYVVSVPECTIQHKKLGAKALAIYGRSQGGTETREAKAANQQAIADTVIQELANLGQQIATLYQTPQDIEWGLANGELYILQSRPITSLFPIPDGAHPGGLLRVFFSLASVQGVFDPITPLGRDTLKGLFGRGGALFKMRRSIANQAIFFTAAERLFIDMTPIFRHPVGRNIEKLALRFIDPAAAQVLHTLLDDPRLQPEKKWFRWRTLRRIAHFSRVMMPRVLAAARQPEKTRIQANREIEVFITDFAMRFRRANSLTDQVKLFESFMDTLVLGIFPRLVSLIIVSMAMLNLLLRLATKVGQNGLLLTRGLPHNVTTEMDLALWQTSRIIAASPASGWFAAQSPELLVDEFLHGALPHDVQTAVSDFLDVYGMRGLAEIDIGRPRWRENPTPIVRSLQSYLTIPENQAPDLLFAAGAEAAADALAALQSALRRTRGGFAKAALAGWATRRLRALAGQRELPKFVIIQIMGIIRANFMQSGRQLVERGVLNQPDDLFFLAYAELKQLAQDETLLADKQLAATYQPLIVQRRAAWKKEARRQQIPRLLLSDGRAFYDGMQPGEEGDLQGDPVSPGIAEGTVRVVLDPHGSQLEPGEILVCPGTDPSWTPLFLTAGGLVMEVGGMMTHGSVVAREYGIPAVVGVHEATKRLQTGQKIRIDGSTGVILILP